MLNKLYGTAADHEAYIRQKAIAMGMDPDVAVRVARHEGLGGKYAGDQGSSFGDFQLHMGGLSSQFPHSGVGDAFRKATGNDPRDASTWKAQIDFALQWAQTHGWGDWSGAKAAGITGFMGVNGPLGPGGGGGTSIGSINVYPPNGDADTIAASIGPAITKAKIIQPANSGPS